MNAKLEMIMKSIHTEMDDIDGKRRMLVELVQKGFKLGLGLDKVRRLMYQVFRITFRILYCQVPFLKQVLLFAECQ